MSSDGGWREMRLLLLGGGLLILGLHFYYFCYGAFRVWHLTSPFLDRLLHNIIKAGLFKNRLRSLLIAAGMMLVSCCGGSGTGRQRSWAAIGSCSALGVIMCLLAWLALKLPLDLPRLALVYMGGICMGFVLIYFSGIALWARISGLFGGDVFNDKNETFPQEERLLTNPYSVNLRGRYPLRGRERQMYVNLTSIFRGVMVVGQSSAGKTFFVIRQIMEQHLEKGFSMFVYDFKYDDLTRLAWNLFSEAERRKPGKRTFHLLSFDDLSRSERCNPLHPDSLEDISDALEVSRTLLFALNREWLRKQGDFFVESAVTIVACGIWFLRRYEDGKYCTLPHLVELMGVDYQKLFSILRSVVDIQSLINAFVAAYESKTMEQLEGQVASARIALSGLSSPKLYYVLSGNDFGFDLNNPAAPKVICMGSSAGKEQVYGAVISVCATRMHKMINKRGGNPCTLIYDEAPTLYLPGLDSLLATGRANQICVVLGIQSVDQLRKGYGQILGDLIFGLPANILCGQASGDTARVVADRFSPILQDRKSFSTHTRSISTTDSKHLDKAIHPGKIATLSSGEFVGIVSDDAAQKKRLKAFHAEIVVDYKRIRRQEGSFCDLPVRGDVTAEMVERNFVAIKEAVQRIVNDRIAMMMDDPGMEELVVRKKEGLGRGRRMD
ncbi:MAG: YWFCY domain-containing protein [Bacteroidota bacterium]|nr:YWFCY domain-containing protein [Bacteroidota bacterium]